MMRSGLKPAIRRVRCRAVADIGVQELVGVLAFHLPKRGLAARIGRRVDGQDIIALFQHQIADKGRTDEAGAAGDDHAHRVIRSS